MFFKMNGKKPKQKREYKADKNKPELEKYDSEILEYIQPQGGIKAYIDHVRTGTGYEACIQIYNFPTYIEAHWITNVCYYEGAITTIDVTTENESAALQNINKSLREYKGRGAAERNDTGIKDAADTYTDLHDMYDQIKRYQKVLKSITVRIYIKSRTLAELEKREEQILTKLDDFKGMIMLNEQHYEWKSMYLPYKEQQEFPNARIGIPMLDEALAAGDPFHFSYLHDPNGLYLGSTSCGGSVIFNQFFKTQIRTYYNVLILGNMGSGKSTLLKKLGHNAFILGDFVRLFDVTGELEYMSEVCGWKRINLDGTDGIFNIFQILKTDVNESICYSRHIAKLDIIYEILSGENDTQEIITFNQCVRRMYLDMEIVPEKIENEIITAYASSAYPTVTDFIEYVKKEIKEITTTKAKTAAEESLLVDEVRRLNNVKRVFESVRDDYGKMLDGHTTIDNIMDMPGVVFNIKNIASLPAHIANTILYSTLSICWDNCTRNGMVMKNLYEEGRISADDITHFLVEFDEAHKIMNARFPVAVQQLTDMQREMRKVFGGLILATQSISECMPDNASAENVQQIKDLFAFSNYKFIGIQDESLVPKLKQAFGTSLTDTEYAKIPKLQQGNFILSIQGDKNIEFKVFASDRELNLFRGGA